MLHESHLLGRKFLFGAAALALAVVSSTSAHALPRDIVLLMADDVGCSDVNCSATIGLPLPNIKALAARGVTATKATSSGPLCVPTRVGTITRGVSTKEPGLHKSGAGAPYYPLPLQKVTLAENLKSKGYATALIGKYPIQNTFAQLPLQNGYDVFRGILNNGQNYVSADGRSSTNIFYDNNTSRTPSQAKHLTLEFQDHAVAFLRAHAGQRRFLHLALTAPHLPYQYTASQWARCAAVPDVQRPYCAMMIGVDDALGAVMAKLASDALVIYVGDNGFAGESKMPSPYRGGKGNPYEGGVRVPLVVSWPGHLPFGAKYQFPVSTLDLYATIVGASRLDSVNLIPFLSGAAVGPAHEDLFWSSRPADGAVRRGQWKFYSFNQGSRIELYNTDTDPDKSSNVALNNQALVSQLRQALADWQSTLAAPF